MMEKNLLIIGASSDVGIDFISKNHHLYNNIIAHFNSSEEQLSALKNRIGEKLTILQADLLEIAALEKFVDDIKKLDITHVLHLPSTKVKNHKFNKTEWEMFQKSYDVQVRSIYTILKEILPKMSKLKYGKVVFLLSSVTNNEPPKYWSDYVTTKYALLGLMKSLAQEYAGKKININAVSPSMMETKFLEEIPEIMIEQQAANSYLGRNAKTEDTTSAVRFLFSDEAEYIVGQNIIVSGGR